MTRRLLLLSSSRDASGVYLLHSASAIRSLLGDTVQRVLFIPYAGVTIAHAEYAERAAVPFAKLGYDLQSIADAKSAVQALERAEAIVVGGGNTFQLLASLYDRNLLDVIRARVHQGVPYIGWSAGAVITAPSIGTTNDMPIIEPKSLRALHRFSSAGASGRDAGRATGGIHRGESHGARARASRGQLASHHR